MRAVQPLRGAALLALSALLFSCMGVLIREASATVNNETVVFFRNLVGVLFFCRCFCSAVRLRSKPDACAPT